MVVPRSIGIAMAAKREPFARRKSDATQRDKRDRARQSDDWIPERMTKLAIPIGVTLAGT
jgi:hypothetical protein